jgi:hypothetical protein
LGHLGALEVKLASDVGFIDLYGGIGVSQLNVFGFLHGFADTVSRILGSLVTGNDFSRVANQAILMRAFPIVEWAPALGCQLEITANSLYS